MNKLVDHEERRTTEVYLNGNQLGSENKSVNIGYDSMLLPDKTIPVALEIKKLKLKNKKLKEENEKFRTFIETIANEGICPHPCSCDTSNVDILCRTGRAREVLK